MIMLFGKQPNVHRCWEMRKKERANARLHQRSLARSHEIKVSIAALSGYRTFASLDRGLNVGASKRKFGSRVKLNAFSG